MQPNQFKYSTGVIAYPILFVLVIWLVFWYQVRIDSSIKSFGVYPQTLKGLRGVIFSPFIHGSITHIYHNTIPLFVLSTALFYFYRAISWKVIVYGILLSGLITWCIGRPANHIGASGLIYVLVSFIFFKGVFAKHYRLIALSLLMVFLYGSMIWYVFPVKQGISWEGHLAGLITGFVFALVFKKQIAKPERYVWEASDYKEEDDEFMRHFDEDGNFIENLDADTDEPKETTQPRLVIRYQYKKKEDGND